MSKFAILWLCCAMITGALLFKTSQHVTDGRQRLENITAEMRSEEDTLRVLQAEWSYLNQPERLEKLAAQYLTLAPMKGRQFIAAADIPLRPAALPEPGPAALADTLAEVIALPAAENMTAELEMASAAAPAVAVPLRKPAGLRLPAAYASPVKRAEGDMPALQPSAPQAAATKQTAQNQKAATADNAAVRRDFMDVLNSLGSGGTR